MNFIINHQYKNQYEVYKLKFNTTESFKNIYWFGNHVLDNVYGLISKGSKML